MAVTLDILNKLLNASKICSFLWVPSLSDGRPATRYVSNKFLRKLTCIQLIHDYTTTIIGLTFSPQKNIIKLRGKQGMY